MTFLKNGVMNAAGFIHRLSLLKPPIHKYIDKHRVQFVPRLNIKCRKNLPFQILTYHRILPEFQPFAIDVKPVDRFRKQVQILASSFRVITVEQLIEEIECNTMKPNTVCITFDDGYLDNFQFAFPILRDHGLSATIFLTTDLINTDRVLWPDTVLLAIKKTNVKRFTYKNAKIVDADFTNLGNRLKTSFALLKWLKRFEPSERDKRIGDILSICRIKAMSTERLMLNWQEVKEMRRAGFSFGSHTKTHPILSSLTAKAAEKEIVESKIAIETALGESIRTFAYPNGQAGDFNENCKSVLERSGYDCALTTIRGINTRETDMYELKRGTPWEQNPRFFYARLLIERFCG